MKKNILFVLFSLFTISCFAQDKNNQASDNKPAQKQDKVQCETNEECNEKAEEILKNNPENKEQAIAYLDYACNEKSARACKSLSNIYLEKKDFSKLKKTYQKGCNSGSRELCHLLGMMYLKGNEDVRIDNNSAKTYFSKNCDNEYGDSCFELANMYREGIACKKNYGTALKFYNLGCKYEGAQACNQLGLLHSSGELVENRNVNEAINYYTKSCNLGFQEACDNLKAISNEDSTADKESSN